VRPLLLCLCALAGTARADVLAHEDVTLKNGLRVLILSDRRAPVVTVLTWYRVGSADEEAGKTGFAHLYEHLMFKGSPHVPDGVIDKLHARVKTNGEIKVIGKGLILAGGNSAGRTTEQMVFATLICEAAAPFIEHSTDPAGVPLSTEGDFEIDDVLEPPPSGCDNPMLLIRTAGSGNWFAVGIPDLD